MKEKNKKYKTEYIFRDNSEHEIKEEYKPTKYVIREIDDEKETIEYKEITINHKLEWENEKELLKSELEFLEEITKERK